jgi:putative component of toxin-antitoxin plasmid stabilization module
VLIILLAGGDKNSQATDIKTAIGLARSLSESKNDGKDEN